MISATCITHDESHTAAIGGRLGELALGGDVFLLSGELGAGKTCLIRGLAGGLGISEHTFSPSFILVREYRGRLPLFHMDFYRLEQQAEIAELGLDEYLSRDGVCAIEWADRAAGLLPADHLEIVLTYVPGLANDRIVALTGRGARHEGLLQQLVAFGDAAWS